MNKTQLGPGDDWHWLTCNCDRCPSKGYVYLLRCERFYKIGYSANVPKRVEQISPIVPFDVELIAYWAYPAQDAQAIEGILQAEWSHRRVKGEWFELSQAEVDGILWHNQRFDERISTVRGIPSEWPLQEAWGL